MERKWMHDNLNEMLHDLEANDGDIDQEDLQQLFEEAEKPFYDGYGINPFGNMSSRYSTWPVLLCMYNLPPWLCMKRKYIMMSLLISDPKQPGNDIDVYLSPLIDDMKTLWKPGIEMYDAYMKEKFILQAMIFCTINNFSAYNNLSGYSTKGKQACPVCEDEISSRWLDNWKKTMFMGHRRSLPRNHPYRDISLEFDGCTEYGRPILPAPAVDFAANVLAEWNALYDAHNEVACLILGSMT
nr:hypothetical protein [Tanacetum cinerariifolium]